MVNLSNPSNIFSRLASQNDYDDFGSIIDISKNEKSEQPTGNIFYQLANEEKTKESNSFGFLDTIKDIGQQVSSKAISGFGGAHGNILEAVGLQSKEQPASEKTRQERDLSIFQKIESGEVPSLGEIESLSEDDFGSPYRLPTTQNIQKQMGIEEGKTPYGRVLGRGAEFVGEGLAIPGGSAKAILSLAGSGLAGQSVREAGGPEALATGVEIGGSFIPSAIQGKLAPRSVEQKSIVDSGRAIGLTEKQITPLIQAEGKTALLSKIARKGTKTKKLFASIKDTLGESYNTLKGSPQAKVNIPRTNKVRLKRDFRNIRNDLSKTLAPSPEKEAAIKYIEKAMKTLGNRNITPEHLINFWQDINKSVKWNSISGGKKALSQLKKPVLDVMNAVSPQIAKDFEMTNQLYTKYSQIAKKLKPDIVDAVINKAELLAIPAAGIALATGNPWILAGIASESALRTLGREMLINPYFQNTGAKIVTNFNQSSLKGVTLLANQVNEYLTKKYPEEDWSFLTED